MTSIKLISKTCRLKFVAMEEFHNHNNLLLLLYFSTGNSFYLKFECSLYYFCQLILIMGCRISIIFK